MSKWIDFVKDWAKTHNITYAKALKDPKMKEAYKSKSPKMKGGATKEQRANASILRTRVANPLKEKLNMIAHSADSIDQIEYFENVERKPRNVYVDYTEDENRVEGADPSPMKVIEDAFRVYFDKLMKMPTDKLRREPDIFPQDGFFVPNNLLPLWDAVVKKLRKTPEEEEGDAMDADAFWTNSNDPRTINFLKLKKKAKDDFVKSRGNFKLPSINELQQAYVNDFEDAVKAYNKRYNKINGENPRKTGIAPNIIDFPVEFGSRKIGGRGFN